MIRRLSHYLLVSASSLVTAVVMLPSGCTLGNGDGCENGFGINPCADEHAELLCTGEGSKHFSRRQCPYGERCVEDKIGEGSCVGSLEGESCASREGCLESPLCLEGRCSPLPPAVVSVCALAPVLHVPTAQDGPEGATLATSFEPGHPVVSPVFDVGPDSIEPSVWCDVTPVGPERVVMLDLSALSSLDHPEDMALLVKVEGLDPKKVSAVTGVALDTCGDPRTWVFSVCDQSPGGLVLTRSVDATKPAMTSIILRATAELTTSVPFTLRAQLVPK